MNSEKIEAQQQGVSLESQAVFEAVWDVMEANPNNPEVLVTTLMSVMVALNDVLKSGGGALFTTTFGNMLIGMEKHGVLTDIQAALSEKGLSDAH